MILISEEKKSDLLFKNISLIELHSFTYVVYLPPDVLDFYFKEIPSIIYNYSFLNTDFEKQSSCFYIHFFNVTDIIYITDNEYLSSITDDNLFIHYYLFYPTNIEHLYILYEYINNIDDLTKLNLQLVITNKINKFFFIKVNNKNNKLIYELMKKFTAFIESQILLNKLI